MGILKNRVCSVTVGIAGGPGNLRQGLKVDGHRISFRVEKTLKKEPNKCECVIYNLGREQRAAIEELRPTKTSARGVPLLIEAGYQDAGPSQIWLGDLRTVWSERVGADWLTHLETGDGEAAKKSTIKVAYGPGTTPDIALRAIVKAIGIDEGNAAAAAIKLRQTGLATLFPQRAVFYGSASVVLDRFCQSAGLEWSVQDSALQILDRDKALGTTSIKLSPSTGLIESPSVDPLGVLTFKMLLQPIRCGGLVTIDSQTAQGTYKVRRLTWDGDTHAQPWYVTGEAVRY